MSRLGWLPIASILTTGCLIEPPPDIEQPTVERPNVNDAQTLPPPFDVLVLDRGLTYQFTVPFYGEDGGEKVIGQMWLNYELEGERLLSQEFLAPRSADDDREREFILDLVVTTSIPAGCQQLSLLITNDNNISRESPTKPIDSSLVGSVTWWANVDAEPGNTTLIDCPVRKSATTVDGN